jgi:putative intracellular protease/amidase
LIYCFLSLGIFFLKSLHEVVQDGLLITAPGPAAAKKFAEAIYELLSR